MTLEKRCLCSNIWTIIWEDSSAGTIKDLEMGHSWVTEMALNPETVSV